MIRNALAALALSLALAAPAVAAPVIIAPVDASRNDPQLAGMLRVLVAAAEARDFSPFEKVLSPQAVANYGGDEGVDGFKRGYHIEDPNSPFWDAFAEAVKLGGVFLQDDLYTTPYTSGDLPESADPYLTLVAIGPKTLLYGAPSDSAPVVADVTHQLLEQADIEADDLARTPEGWVRVKADAGEGYVKQAEVRSPLDYRAVFQKTGEGWKLIAFVAGD